MAYSLENVVYLELCRRGYTVNVGISGSTEIDFAGRTGGNIIRLPVGGNIIRLPVGGNIIRRPPLHKSKKRAIMNAQKT